jgi:hypothetical protein
LTREESSGGIILCIKIDVSPVIPRSLSAVVRVRPVNLTLPVVLGKTFKLDGRWSEKVTFNGMVD